MMILKAAKRLLPMGGQRDQLTDTQVENSAGSGENSNSIEQSDLSSESYKIRVQQQIEQYATEAIHDLPEIFHVWSQNFIGPGLLDVFGVTTVNEFYVDAVRLSSADFANQCKILSVGCGDGEVEMQLARTLRDRGADFRLEAIDLSPLLIERFENLVREHALGDRVFPKVGDLNDAGKSGPYNMIMANHSLHHMVDLEKLFDFIKASLNDNGIFATADMIGRNGHMRWPETEALLQAVWPLLSEKQRYNHQLRELYLDRFEDFDCSNEGFEGIRAQDILYLILDRFHPYKFFGYGGFVDVLVDRGYGHGFDADNERDKALVTSLATINDIMLDAGMIKPTVMMAYFTKDDRGETHFRSRSAKSCVRLPFLTPEWAQS